MPTTIEMRPQPIATAAFAPYGQVIEATGDGTTFGPRDAQLELSRGTPRFYIMALERRVPEIRAITRHAKVTQCLASVGGARWYLLVAPPSDAAPDESKLAAFEVPGHVAIKLHVGAWHAGPYFAAPRCDFFNLELSDTNENDHHTVALAACYRLAFENATA